MHSKKAVVTIVAVLMLTGVVGLSLLAYERLECKATLTKIASELRAMTYRISQTIDSTGEIPRTYHLLAVADPAFYPSVGDPYCTGRGVEEYTFGSFVCKDILNGHVNTSMLRDTAERNGVAEQSWEFITGCWFSREIDAYRSGSPDVVVAINRQNLRLRDEPDIYVSTANGMVRTILRGSDSEEMESALESDRRARDHLNLAPLPEEFRTWLITGEPASVGDGTFAPPTLLSTRTQNPPDHEDANREDDQRERVRQ